MQRIAIVGVGLIGGSFALALKAAGFTGEVIGVSSPATLRAAQEHHIVDSIASLEQAAARADVIYLAQPIGRILDVIHRLDALVLPHALVTDAGSTKQAIVHAARAALHRCQFLGGHPMAGKETRGVASADAELFRGRPYVLTPSHPDQLETPIAAEFLRWVERIGARPVILGAEEHDRLVAFSSHVPQLASTALGAAMAEHAPEARQVAGPGLVDATRLALSSYDLWRDIITTNTMEIESALTAYIQELEHLRENLRTRQLQEEFEKGAEFAASLRKS